MQLRIAHRERLSKRGRAELVNSWARCSGGSNLRKIDHSWRQICAREMAEIANVLGTCLELSRARASDAASDVRAVVRVANIVGEFTVCVPMGTDPEGEPEFSVTAPDGSKTTTLAAAQRKCAELLTERSHTGVASKKQRPNTAPAASSAAAAPQQQE